MSNNVQLLLKVKPDIRMKLRILAMIHDTTLSKFVSQFVESAWQHEPQTKDVRIQNYIKRQVKENKDAMWKQELESDEKIEPDNEEL